MYFYMFNHCIRNNNVIYDLILNKKYELNEVLISFLEDFKQHIDSDKIIEKYGKDAVKEFQDIFAKNNLGCFSKEYSAIEQISSYNKYKIDMESAMPLYLEFMVLELTGRCNLKCNFCSSDLSIYRSCGCKLWDYAEVLSDEEWIMISDEIIKLRPRTIVFSGGEPLLRKDLLVELILKFKNAGIECAVYTNGELLDEQLIEFFVKTSVSLFIQIVSFKNETYKRITESSKEFSPLFYNIMEYINKGGSATFNILVCKENENEIDEIELTLSNSNLKFQKAYLFPPNSGLSLKYYDESIASGNKNATPVTFQNYYYLQEKNSCLTNSIFISANGKVFPCMMLRDFCLGDLKSEKLYQIFRTESYREFWKLSKSRVKYCCDCGYNIGCQDCRALEYQSTGDIRGMKYCEKVGGKEECYVG